MTDVYKTTIRRGTGDTAVSLASGELERERKNCSTKAKVFLTIGLSLSVFGLLRQTTDLQSDSGTKNIAVLSSLALLAAQGWKREGEMAEGLLRNERKGETK